MNDELMRQDAHRNARTQHLMCILVYVAQSARIAESAHGFGFVWCAVVVPTLGVCPQQTKSREHECATVWMLETVGCALLHCRLHAPSLIMNAKHVDEHGSKRRMPVPRSTEAQSQSEPIGHCQMKSER
jgi:hypothetical protein